MSCFGWSWTSVCPEGHEGSAHPAAADDAYAIRFANEGIWAAGLNVLGSIVLDHDAPGGARPSQPFELNGG